MSGLVLVIEDDRGVCAMLRAQLASAGYEIQLCYDGSSALEAASARAPDVICLDLGLPDMSGLDWLARARSLGVRAPVLVFTSDASVPTVVSAMRAGALDYVLKPVDRSKLLASVEAALRYGRPSVVQGRDGLLGQSPSMLALQRQIERIAGSDITVLLHGESGTGKELIAKAIHRRSPAPDAPFVAVNCAAIPDALQESELFGHERGAFTGATQRVLGKFEQAHGGTLFLDEVAELKLELQAKLLRALQERRFHRVGGQGEVESRFRLIAASHRDLGAEVAAGRFRDDLYFRLAVFELEVPPLRARDQDVVLLAEHFCREFGQRAGRDVRISDSLRAFLLSYDWPGNVRELQNALQRAVVVAEGAELRVEDLPRRIRRGSDGPETEKTGTSSEPPLALGRVGTGPVTALPEDMDLESVERRTILAALERASGSMSQAARELGIGRTTLYRKVRKYGLIP